MLRVKPYNINFPAFSLFQENTWKHKDRGAHNTGLAPSTEDKPTKCHCAVPSTSVLRWLEPTGTYQNLPP